MAKLHRQGTKKEEPSDSIHSTIREWVDQSGKLEIFVVGKLGSGKSTLINSLLDQEVMEVGSSLKAVTKRIDSFEAVLKTEFTVSDIQIILWDSPGLQEPNVNKEDVLRDIALKCGKNVDLVVYCVQMTQSRIDAAEVECINDLTRTLGVELWDKALFALTFANDMTIPRSHKEKNLEIYFHERRAEWAELLRHYVDEAGMGAEKAACVPIVPTGYSKEPLPFLATNDHWLTEFWTMCCKKVSLESFPALFMVNRNIQYNEIEDQKYSEVLHDRLKGLGSNLDEAIVDWFSSVGINTSDRHLWVQFKTYVKYKMGRFKHLVTEENEKK